MMALVRGVMAASTCARSMARVCNSQSTTTGVAPALTIMFIAEKKVWAELITSSPAPMPHTCSAISIAPVADVTTRVGRAPKRIGAGRI